MGNHRGARRATSRVRSERPVEGYVGRRVAGRESAPPTTRDVDLASVAEPPAPVGIPATVFSDTTTASMRPAVPGKRRAAKAPRTPLRRGLPSMPVAVGVAVLAVSTGGVLTTNGPQLVTSDVQRVAAPNAASGEIGAASYNAVGRSPVVSRDSDRDALEDASEATLVQEAELQAEQRNEALGNLAEQAEKEAKTINSNRWSLPIASGYRLSAEFGQAGGYWSSGYHTGLDFAAPSGTPIMSIANGVVTSVGYEGAYGNQTIVTLEDGTEVWYCHQTSYDVSVGDNVVAGEVIGSVGSTGNSTGPHLHLEIRPGGGDPVDPFAALVVNGVSP